MAQTADGLLGRKIMIAVYMALNLLFVLKYGSRLGAFIVSALVVGYMVAGAAVYRLAAYVDRYRRVLLAVCALALAGLFVAQGLIDPYRLQVDRWSAIDHHLQYLLHGRYPYAAQTHLGGYGSPLPVWQILHLPFYLLGNVGLSSLVCIGVYLHSLCRWQGVGTMLTAWLLLMGSPAVWYEVAVRSDLMANFMLVAAVVQYLIYYKVELSRHVVLCGVLCGLLLSTRLGVAVPLAIYFMAAYMRLRLRQQVLMVLVVAVSFGITLLPYLLWSSDLFLFEYNPFVLQTRQGHATDALVLVPLMLWAAWYSRGVASRYFAATGVCMAMCVVVVLAHNMVIEGNYTALFDARYDISYMDMSLPFIVSWLALSMSRRQMMA